MISDYNPWEQFQDLIAQTNDNTSMIKTIILHHNQLDQQYREHLLEYAAIVEDLNSRIQLLEEMLVIK